MKEIKGIIFTWDLVENCALFAFVAWILTYFLQIIGLLGCSILVYGVTITAAVAGAIAVSQMTVEPAGKAIFITGCDTGFGHRLAFILHEMGFTIFAGCLLCDKDGEGARKLKEVKTRMHVIQLDVTSDESVAEAMKYVKNVLQESTEISGLWAVINNAGLGSFGEVEWVPIADYQRILEVNLLGAVRMIKGCLPLLRRTKGRIINVSSVLGRITTPMRATYCATKWAIEGMSDSVRLDLRRWGVDVVLVEPGNFVAATGISVLTAQAKRLWDNMDEDVKRDYGKEYYDYKIDRMKQVSMTGSTDVSPVIYAMKQSVIQKYPQRRYQPMDWKYKLQLYIYTHLPERVFEKLFY